jgi:hypothetical protein
MKRPPNIKNTFVLKKDTIQWFFGTNQNQHSQQICTKFGAGGIGGLTDHGIHKKSHGERRKDYTFVQNSGRGPQFLEFQKYVLGNLGITAPSYALDSNHPTKLLVSVSASKLSGVQLFQKQISALQTRFPADQIAVQKVIMSELSLRERFQQASESHFYISVMGDGVLPAFCMPRGATLIIFYNDISEFVSVSKNEKSFPSKIDWDLWNNLSYLHVHWLPLSTINEPDDINLLSGIIQTQIEISQLETTAEAISTAPIKRDPDGNFNGLDVFYVNRPQISTSHCTGENFQERSHSLKSCKFQYICLDLSTGNFSIAASDNQSLLMKNKQKGNGPNA